MDIQELKDGDVLVLVPSRSVFGRDEAIVAEAGLTAAIKTGTKFVVLDCAAVSQMTSDATRVLLMASRKLDRIQGRLVLCSMNAKLKKAFSVSGFNKDFTVTTTREEAVQRVVEPVAPRPVRIAPPPPPPKPVSAKPAEPHTKPVGADAKPARDSEPATESDAPTVVGVPRVPASDPSVESDAPTVVGMPPMMGARSDRSSESDAPTVVGMPPMTDSAESDAKTVVMVPHAAAPDPREAMATSLFDALGVDVSRRGASRHGSVAHHGAESVAGSLLALLRGRAS